jgi:hypothetical protein
MIQTKKYDKKAVAIAITVLVLMTFLLIGITLSIFAVNSSKIGTQVKDARVLNQLYYKENQINFYVSDIIGRAASNIDREKDIKSQFINNFNQELLKYRNNLSETNKSYVIDELKQVEGKVNPESVNVNGNNLSVQLSFRLDRDFGNGLVVSYLYKKDFNSGEIKYGRGNPALVNTINTKSPDVHLSLGVFQFLDGVALEADIYYNYSGKWYWSFQYGVDPKYIEWRSVDINYHKSSGMNLKNQRFIESLRGKNCDEGLNLLIARALKNDEGGLLKSPSVYFYGSGKSGEIDLENKGIDCSNAPSYLKS